MEHDKSEKSFVAYEIYANHAMPLHAAPKPAGFMDRMKVLNRLPDADAVALVRELGVDVIAVHGAAAHAGNPLWDFFSGQEWAGVVRFPNDEFVVMIKR